MEESKLIEALFDGRDLQVNMQFGKIQMGDVLVFSNGQKSLIGNKGDSYSLRGPSLAFLAVLERSPVKPNLIGKHYLLYRNSDNKEKFPVFYNVRTGEFKSNFPSYNVYDGQLNKAGITKKASKKIQP